MKTVNKHLSNELAYFYKSLTVEKKNFDLPFSELQQSRLLVTERRNGKIVGIAGISKRKSFFLVVKSEYKNQKIGQKLTKKVIEHTRKKKYHYITLNVFQSNLKAVHIYRKFGFTFLLTNIIGPRKKFFMILPLDLKGWLCKIYILMVHKLRSITRHVPYEYALCTRIRRLANKVKDSFLE